MLEAIILGIVQGITEFLPVSSTAHLILLPWFFSWYGSVDTLTFDVALHAGTLCALLLCFWKDWMDLLLRKQKLLSLIILASDPGGFAGYLLNDIVENSLRQPLLISLMLIGVGIIMAVAPVALPGAYEDRRDRAGSHGQQGGRGDAGHQPQAGLQRHLRSRLDSRRAVWFVGFPGIVCFP